VVLSLLAARELIDARSDRTVSTSGVGNLARIDPCSADPAVWRWTPGVGPVLGRRLADAAGEGLITASGDLQRVFGIGPMMAKRLRKHVRWDPHQ
jgi:DNA uptake protein ComE-like DNA-binding protein